MLIGHSARKASIAAAIVVAGARWGRAGTMFGTSGKQSGILSGLFSRTQSAFTIVGAKLPKE